jgi:APA family basic amino acid/polyamine antiporter
VNSVGPAAETGLRRGVGLTGVVMFGAGTAIGVSIFSVLQPAAEIAGSGLLVAVAIAALPMLFFAAVYAWLASAMPISGASYEWPRRFLSPFAGFAIAWLRILSNVGALVVLARVLANYLGMAIAVPAMPLIACALTGVFILNYIGVHVAARLQTALMLLLIAVLALFVALGLPRAEAAMIGAPLSAGTAAILAGVPLMISLFLGIESAVEIGEEVRDPRRNIPLGILLAILLTAVIYAAVAATALGLIGPEALARSDAPLLDAARVPLGVWATPVIVGAATLAILKTMNATALIFSRSLFAMARAGVFPSALAAIHPRFGTPHRAIILCYVLAMCGLLMPPSLVFLLLAVNIPTMLKYGACSLCAVRVAARPDLLDAPPALHFPPRLMMAVGWLGVVAAVAIIAAGLEADHRPYLLVLGWLAIGLLYYAVHARRIGGKFMQKNA